jgi:hypothetical protein
MRAGSRRQPQIPRDQRDAGTWILAFYCAIAVGVLIGILWLVFSFLGHASSMG